MMDLLLSHSPACAIIGAEAWEFQLDETVKHVGATSAGIGGSTSGIGAYAVRPGRGGRFV